MKKLFSYLFFIAVSSNIYAQPTSSPIDKKATKETKALYKNLRSLMSKGIMFGHQDDPAYGVNWKYQPGRSDIKDITGDYPALYGFELGRIELDHTLNLDSVPFDSARRYIEQAYARGGVITISWHLNNPLNGEVAWAPEPGRAVASVLPGREKNTLYKSWLDKVATFVLSLKGKNGEPIPVIFRPFHELNGNWFWWGKDHCTPQEFEQLWHLTVSYLKDKKNIHQILYAFSTDKFSSKEEYLAKYPGDEWVDIIGFDSYQRKGGAEGNADYIKAMDTMLTMLDEIAVEKNKIPALTEFGYSEIPDSTWWTNVLYKAIGHHKISYMLAWRNAGYKSPTETEYYVPYKGQASEKNFIKFYQMPNILFQKNINYKMIYQTVPLSPSKYKLNK
ncbi:MAG: glycosyl hydrolase [Ferruginibacter sp.]